MIDLVMGAAYGYNAEQIRPLLKSLKQTGYRGRVVLFADETAADEARVQGAAVLPCPAFHTLPHAERFYWLKKVLDLTEATGVFLTDTRDVIFQKNPAECLPSEGLNVFEEPAVVSLFNCPFNSDWMRTGYGEQTLRDIGNRPIICVGSICGDLKSVRTHVNHLCSEIQLCQPRTSKPQDQSCHNYLIRSFNLGTVWSNEHSEVYTVGYLPKGSVQVVEGTIRNKAGKVPAVIHQWDRHDNLAALVKEKYA